MANKDDQKNCTVNRITSFQRNKKLKGKKMKIKKNKNKINEIIVQRALLSFAYITFFLHNLMWPWINLSKVRSSMN